MESGYGVSGELVGLTSDITVKQGLTKYCACASYSVMPPEVICRPDPSGQVRDCGTSSGNLGSSGAGAGFGVDIGGSITRLVALPDVQRKLWLNARHRNTVDGKCKVKKAFIFANQVVTHCVDSIHASSP